MTCGTPSSCDTPVLGGLKREFGIGDREEKISDQSKSELRREGGEKYPNVVCHLEQAHQNLQASRAMNKQMQP